MAVSRETLRGMIDDFGMIPLTDEELDYILPAVQAQVDAMARLDADVDLSMVPPGAIWHAEPGR